MRYTRRPSRRASVLPLLGVCLIALFGFVALAVDLGILAVSRTQCQNAADVAALVGARNLNNQEGTSDTNRAAAVEAAKQAVARNPHLSRYFSAADVASVTAGQYRYDGSKFVVAYPGSLPAGESWSAMEVVLSARQPTYFMRVMGVTSMPTGARAVAVHRPRDIAIVLDFSGSMGYGSTLNWPFTWPAGEAPQVEGLMNPDPAYPKFGHYARYAFYQNTDPSAARAASATVADRPNPLQMKGFSGDFAPNNHTMTTGGGPPAIEDFLTAPGDPPAVGQITPVRNAFKMWNPTRVAPPVTSTLTPARYDWTGYNAAVAACPAPDNFDTQSDTPVPYVGDRWPRKDGTRGARADEWTTLAGGAFNDNGAYTLKDYLGSAAAGPRDLTRLTLPSPAGFPAAYANTLPAGGQKADQLLPTLAQRAHNRVDGGSSDANYFDVLWERYGYDLDVKDLRDQPGQDRSVKLRSDRFQGYSMGPGYWGKTFFVWPPDPRFGVVNADGSVTPPDVTRPDPNNPAFDVNGRPMCDWRRRFFLKADGTPFDPQTDDINGTLFETTAAGHVLKPIATYSYDGAGQIAGVTAVNYRLNYRAIMAWLKTGPQTLPSNLRAGRILYYSSTPDDLTTSAAGSPEDRMFWREYVHFVLGVGPFDPATAPLSGSWGSAPIAAGWGYPPQVMLAGVESRFPFGPLARTTTAAYTPPPYLPSSTTPVANPRPYMGYADNVNRPRMHFWFGPQTMLQFLKRNGEDRPWWAGTVREAQCWQLKAAINSVLDDVRRNHPNDHCGIAGFATRNHFNTPLAPMGQDWYTLKNVLFFRKDTVADMRANLVAGTGVTSSTLEHRPYDPVMFYNDTAKIPNGSGGTDPNTGLAVAFNMLSSSPTLIAGGEYGRGGRKGAAKVVIFETDGLPNATRKWYLTGSGEDTRYYYDANAAAAPESWTKDGSAINTQARYAVRVAERIVSPVSSSGPSGYSLPNAPARVYAIAFGDLFNGYDGTNYNSLSPSAKGALRFLLRVQQVGGTSPGGPGTADPPAAGLPLEHVITGPYDVRIEKLRSALERIVQNGVQVTLVE